MASVRRPMSDRAGSITDPLQDTAKPISQTCGASVIRYLRKRKNAAKAEEEPGGKSEKQQTKHQSREEAEKKVEELFQAPE